MDNDFHKRLLATFRIETKEHLSVLSAALIALEEATEEGTRQELIEKVFREAHSMKGAARAVNVGGIESLSHALENVFSAVKRRECTPSAALFDLLHRAIDAIDAQLASPGPEGDTGARAKERGLIRTLEIAARGVPAPAPPPPRQEDLWEPSHPEPSPVADTIRISAGKLDVILHQTEELLFARLAARQRAADLADITSALTSWEKEWKKIQPVLRAMGRGRRSPTVHPSPEADAGYPATLMEYCEASHSAVKSVQQSIQKLAKEVAGDRHALDVMVDNLLESLKDVLMLPCATVLEILPKMVRDLARDRGKEAELVITGESIEIDKRVLEELKEPLIHLVRNCIDHGLERPEERRARNKQARGRITVDVAFVGSGRIEIVVADDGGGIDTSRLAEAAARQGADLPGEGEAAHGGEILDLIFRSGISTSPLITDISGRGLGLAIVREKVEKLGGTVSVVSEPLKGTTFRMAFPLTLSTYRGILVKAGAETFIVPAAGVECVARINRDSLKTVENRETVELNGSVLSFARLADILQLSRSAVAPDGATALQIFVVGSGANRIAFGVDAVLGDQEVLVKGLGPLLARVRNITGATVLGNGKIATILHPGDLVKSAVKGAAAFAAAHRGEEAATVRKTVLVVEDSITSRALLKNILETAGYHTVAAVDGIDALTQLQTERIDLVVSDVDMPRMNGLDLTARIRSTGELADLPVVLVTSLDSREDRERGIEVGANAYIVKSSFDQSNLLEAIKRLI